MRMPKIGSSVKVVANTSSHGFKIGDEVIVTGHHSNTSTGQITARNPITNGNYTLNGADYSQLVQLEALKKEIEQLEKNLLKAKRCTEYLELSKKEEANPEEVNAYYVLQLVNDTKMSDIEKASEIARLLS